MRYWTGSLNPGGAAGRSPLSDPPHGKMSSMLLTVLHARADANGPSATVHNNIFTSCSNFCQGVCAAPGREFGRWSRRRVRHLSRLVDWSDDDTDQHIDISPRTMYADRSLGLSLRSLLGYLQFSRWLIGCTLPPASALCLRMMKAMLEPRT